MFVKTRELFVVNIDQFERGHELRLVLKRLIAILRLIERKPKGKSLRLLKDVKKLSKEVGKIRDTDVINRLVMQYKPKLKASELNVILGLLEKKRQTGSIRKIQITLLHLEKNLETMVNGYLTSDDELLGGIKRTHQEAIMGLKKAKRSRTKLDFHCLRKTVKRLEFQLEAFYNSDFPDDLWTKATKLKVLTSTLGKAHDSVIIEDLIKKNPKLRDLSQRLKKQRKALENDGILLAQKILPHIELITN